MYGKYNGEPFLIQTKSQKSIHQTLKLENNLLFEKKKTANEINMTIFFHFEKTRKKHGK